MTGVQTCALPIWHLSGKYVDDPHAVGRVTLFKGYAQRYTKPNVAAASAAYAQLARANNLAPTQLALSFVMQRWCVASTIIGATSMAQIQDNIAAYQVKLSPETLKEIDAIHLRFTNPAP